MSDARKPRMKEAAEDAPLPKLDVENQPKRAPDRPLSPEQSYLQRKAQVAQQDHEVFSEYLQEKIAREQQQKVQFAEPPPKAPTKVNRRSLLTWVAGTAVVGEAVTLGFRWSRVRAFRPRDFSTVAAPTPRPSAIRSIVNSSIPRPTSAGGISAAGFF
jgi:hypothetical protein